MNDRTYMRRCPECGALPGFPCRTRTADRRGKTIAVIRERPHDARRPPKETEAGRE